MKRNRLLPRLGALALALSLLLSPAQALTLDQARELLEENYVDPIPQEVLDLPTLPAILEALGDPYTEYLTAQENEAFMSSMSDTVLGGIGVTCAMTEEGLLVSEVTQNAPAQAAGIRAGDVLVAVDGEPIPGMALEEATGRIRGAEGTKVRVTYLRQGRSRTVTLTRTAITIPATTGRLLEGSVGYIDCDTWGEETPVHFRELIEEMDGQVGCWLIDLRSNTGGMTAAVADTAQLFCGAGPFVSLRLRDDSTEDGYAYHVYAAQGEAITDKPVVILVDGYTASASEAFVAAMRDYGRGVAVGSRTYGKGVAQGLWDREVAPDCFPDGDSLKITIARFYSPIGNTNDVIGLIPEVLTADEEAGEVGAALARTLAQAGEDWPQELELVLADEIDRGLIFPDTDDHPYELSITALAAYGLVSGKGDGSFHPEDTLTRAELAQLLQNALNCRRESAAAFDDVAADAWYAQAVSAMTALGLMDGTGEDLFAPDRALTHQELFTVLGRLGQWLNDDLDLAARTAEAQQLAIRPLEGYDDWAKRAVWLLSCGLENSEGGLVNLLWNDPEYIDPTAPATRGEAAEALYNLLYYLGILP